MPRPRNFQRASGSRPNRSWGGLTLSGVTIAASTKVLAATFTLDNANIDETILRTRGSFMATPASSAIDQSVVAAWGMYLVTDLAAAAGVASIPGPVTDISDDGWFVWEPILLQYEVVTAVGVDAMFGAVRPFDSKAKRILQEGRQVALVVENTAGAGFQFSLALRTLTMVRGTR